jgi:hypothetical protein
MVKDSRDGKRYVIDFDTMKMTPYKDYFAGNEIKDDSLERIVKKER